MARFSGTLPELQVEPMIEWTGRTAAVLALGLALAGPALGEQASPSPAAPPAKAAHEDYRIGAGDALQVFVWKEPDLSREVTVRLDGRITVPLLGDIEAAGRT